jgi:tRNA A37 methylthiotransferase MiaB
VSLINPPSAPGTLANREGAAGMGTVYTGDKTFLYPPHTLASVAATLRGAGHEVHLADAVVDELSPDALYADVIGVFVSCASLDADLAFLQSLHKQSSARLVALGPAMRFVGPQVLERARVDVWVGESEGFAAEALVALKAASGARAPHIWSAAEVQAAGCDADGWVKDLDALPFPAWDLLPVQQHTLLTVLASRGCPDRCAYCPYAAAQGHHFRSRSVESVLGELAWLGERFRPARIVFRDPVFAYSHQRVLTLCEGILKRRLRLRWECESRPEHLDIDLLRLMQRAGCQWVKVGLETTNAGLLQRLGRVNSAEEAAAYLRHVAQVVDACAEIGLYCRLFVMAGLPGQDVAMADGTRQFLTTLRPAALNVKGYDSYPGLPVETAASADADAQLQVLQQAQADIQRARSTPGPLARSKRWLRGVLPGLVDKTRRGGRHG